MPEAEEPAEAESKLRYLTELRLAQVRGFLSFLTVLFPDKSKLRHLEEWRLVKVRGFPLSFRVLSFFSSVAYLLSYFVYRCCYSRCYDQARNSCGEESEENCLPIKISFWLINYCIPQNCSIACPPPFFFHKRAPKVVRKHAIYVGGGYCCQWTMCSTHAYHHQLFTLPSWRSFLPGNECDFCSTQKAAFRLCSN